MPQARTTGASRKDLGRSTKVRAVKGVHEAQVNQFLSNARLSETLDPVLMKLWSLIKYRQAMSAISTQQRPSLSSQPESPEVRKLNKEADASQAVGSLSVALYLRLLICIQLALFIVDDANIYHPEQLRIGFNVSNPLSVI